MTRPHHALWACVDELDDGTAECKYCDHKYGEDTSITRIRLHLSGVTGKGVKPCGKVPKNIKEVALARNGSSRIPPGEVLVGRLAGHNWEGMYAESIAFLFGENSETRGDPLPTSSTKEAFEEDTRKIGSWIMDDEVSTIGIYGMTGVGKTELLKHIYNKLLQSHDSTHRLYWMHVSQNFSIKSLQNLIATLISLKLLSEDDDLHRPIKLSNELRLNQRWILFLDDLGGDFKLDAVGIPETIKGCKLIVSTRSEKVCLTVASRSIIVNPLSHEEAMSLFMKNLGLRPGNELSPAKKQFAKCIVNKCGGLPLGIIAMARSMKSLYFNTQWKKALQDLEKSIAGQSHMEMVFPSLKSSYTLLKDCQRRAFLRCALFPKSFMIPRDDLIAFLIDDGVIKMQNSREAEYRTGRDLIDRLKDVCLLESIDGGSAVKMHDLIRDMAIETYQEDYPAIIKAGENLKNLPGARDWGGTLVTASLIENQIKEIPSRHSPRCHSLSTLLLHYNRELELIEDLFFNQLHGLNILDLSHTVIEKLPDSVSNLVRLTTLLLIDCKKLVHVPSLEKLSEMRRLDLYNTALENIPQGLECLSELRYLRMSNCGQKEFPGGILRELSHLQVLILGWGKYAPMTVKGEEVGCLENLEDLECHFNGHSDLVEFIKYQDKTRPLKTYKVRVGQFEENDDFLAELYDWGNNQIEENDDYLAEFGDCSNNYGDIQAIFPNYNQKRINGECSGMESFVSSARFLSIPLPMPSNNGKFSCLKEFYCFGCKSMKKLLPRVFLENLEVIEVIDCEKMVEIIATTSDDEGLIEFPKLKTLKLIKLPELKSIFSAKLFCYSLKVIHIINCEKLKRIPIFLPFLESNQSYSQPSLEIIIHPKERWESALEWDHPNAKDALRHFVKK